VNVLRVPIVGAGVAGLALARALYQRGTTAELVERSTTWPQSGAGLYLPGNALRALRELGVESAVAALASDPAGVNGKDWRELFADFAEPVPRLLDQASEAHSAPIEEVVPPAWTAHRVVLVGDAAHASSPNMAQGAVRIKMSRTFPLDPEIGCGRTGARDEEPGAVVTIDDVGSYAIGLPRTTEALVRGRVKFRVGRIVYVAFSRDETVMGFAFAFSTHGRWSCPSGWLSRRRHARCSAAISR
jgi:hypothetical protein